eukprot:541238-Prorocentrum_minimum.AAC.1
MLTRAVSRGIGRRVHLAPAGQPEQHAHHSEDGAQGVDDRADPHAHEGPRHRRHARAVPPRAKGPLPALSIAPATPSRPPPDPLLTPSRSRARFFFLRRRRLTPRTAAQSEIPAADGKDSDADGRDSDADGRNSDADGRDSDADGRKSDADGRDSDADGRDSDADGRDSGADGRDSGADGRDSDADGRDSDADGRDSDADGRDSDADRQLTVGTLEMGLRVTDLRPPHGLSPQAHMVFSKDDLCRSLVEVATQRSGRFATVYDTCDRVLGAGVARRFSERLLPAYDAVSAMLELSLIHISEPTRRS